MKIATSPFVYWGVAFFMPEKVGNLQPFRVCFAKANAILDFV
jgi:hypothetical protein